MKQLFMAAIAAILALLGTPTLADDVKVAIATTTDSAVAQPSASSIQQGIRQNLMDGEWAIMIYQLPSAGQSARGLTTFKDMDGQLTAVVKEKGEQSLMSVEIDADGLITLTSRTWGSKILLRQKPDQNFFAGTRHYKTREWVADMRKL